MPLQRIAELEQLLATANASLALLTLTNTHLTSDLTAAETRNRKLRRGARQDEMKFKEQLQMALSKRPL